MQVMLKNIRITFPALAEPQAFGEGEPAYGAKFIIEPNGEHAKLIEAAMATAAQEKWKDDAEATLAELIDDKKVCFVKKEYTNKKTRQPFAGFEKKWYLTARNASTQPTVFDRFASEIKDKRDIQRVVYSGAYVNAKVDIWPQDNKWGQRVNCTLMGVMFAADGESFGGASVASVDDFAEFADDAEDMF